MASIEVFPRERVMLANGEQQLSVMATYTDGHVEDVTRASLFEPNEKEIAEVEELGLVRMNSQPGDVAVMVRYQGKVAVSIASLPLGAPVKHLPRNAISSTHWYSKSCRRSACHRAKFVMTKRLYVA